MIRFNNTSVTVVALYCDILRPNQLKKQDGLEVSDRFSSARNSSVAHYSCLSAHS